MTWTITTTTTISASRAVTLAERIPSEPIKFIVLHPGTGAGGTVTIWDDLGRSVSSTRVDALSPRHEAEFYSDRSVFNISAAIDGNATLDGAGASVYLVSREAPDPSIADGSTSFAGPVGAPNLGAASGRWAQSIIPHRTLPYTAINNKGLQLTTGQSLLVRRPAPIKQSEGRVFGYKVVVENFDSAAVGNITLAKAATQVAQANLHGVGNGTPVNITWGGSAGVSIPVAATLPGGTTVGDDNPGRSISDYIAHPDVARTDGGEYALYDFRFLAGASLYFGIRDNATIPTDVGPAECRDQFASSDRVTTWSDMTVNNGPDMCPMVWIIWYTTKGVIVSDLFGDSVMGGSGTEAARRSIPAVALTSLGIHCNVISHGGQIFPSTSQVIQSVAGTAIANGKIAVLRCASEVNDGANALLSWRWFLDAYEKLRSQGKLVLVMGPAPYNSAYVEQLCALLDESGIPWFDQIPYLGTDFRHYKAGLTTDNIHPNDAGTNATWPAFAEWCRPQLLSAGF